MEALPPAEAVDSPVQAAAQVPANYAHLFKVGHSISRFQPVAGNRAQLMADSSATIEYMVADIDPATDQVNVLFYIWLTDNNGVKIAAALMRAATRGWPVASWWTAWARAHC